MAATEWTIECENCKWFNYIGPEPVLCPKCQSTEITVYNDWAEVDGRQVTTHVD